jgi:hypothetical protein
MQDLRVMSLRLTGRNLYRALCRELKEDRRREMNGRNFELLTEKHAAT